MKLFILILLVNVVTLSNCAKILGIFYFPSKSHHILGSTLLKALAAKGHQVTMVSPFPFEKPVANYTDIDLPGLLKYKEEHMANTVIGNRNTTVFEELTSLFKFLKIMEDMFFENRAIQELLQSKQKFDVVMFSWSFNEAFLGIADHFNASSIIFSCVGSTLVTNKITRNPAPYSYVPNMLVTYSDDMTFLQRLLNTASNIVFDAMNYFFTHALQEEFLKKYFPKAPPLQQLLDNVSLIFLNSHYSIESPRPYVPNVVQIGGFHIQPAKELSPELKQYLDAAQEGVIFFSLGTNVQSTDLPEETQAHILNSFSKLKLKVLWKFEIDLPNLPKNVRIGKWFPQGDILAHPNVKLFISHGGLLSTSEAVYHGVPIVGIPFFADQKHNVADSVEKGYAVLLDFFDITEQTFSNAISKVLNNPEYRENVKRVSAILRDQPLKPLDKAVYWVEYVIRHKGASHLRTAAVKLTWYQYMLLDVIGVLLIAFVAILAIIYFCILFLLYLIKQFLKSLRNNCWKKVKTN